MARSQKGQAGGVASPRMVNRRARFDYHIEQTIEAGLALHGTEVKSLRNGQGRLDGGFARFRGAELWLYGVTIAPYEQGNQLNHEPLRPRKLLLHRHEINKLISRLQQRGWTLVPLSLYFKRGFAKVELALARGKTHGDKRQDIKTRDAQREMQRAMARR